MRPYLSKTHCLALAHMTKSVQTDNVLYELSRFFLFVFFGTLSVPLKAERWEELPEETGVC